MAVDKYAHLSPFSERDIENRFSHWYDNIKNCGIAMPETVVTKIPADIQRAFYMEHPDDRSAVRAWLNEYVMPALVENKLTGLLFIKNAVFSGKFDAVRNCFCLSDVDHLTDNIINIMQGAACMIMGYDGFDEIVIRRWLDHDPAHTPCMYNGLPLRPEFRVFYDFDIHDVIFVANYWDHDYVYPNLYDITDKIIFASMRSHIETEFLLNKDHVADLVREHMKDITGLTGPWSIDIMKNDDGEFYLIDMAVAEQSAYWDYRPGNEENLAAERARRRDDERRRDAIASNIIEPVE